jgi:hypothetical protein
VIDQLKIVVETEVNALLLIENFGVPDLELVLLSDITYLG